MSVLYPCPVIPETARIRRNNSLGERIEKNVFETVGCEPKGYVPKRRSVVYICTFVHMYTSIYV